MPDAEDMAYALNLNSVKLAFIILDKDSTQGTSKTRNYFSIT